MDASFLLPNSVVSGGGHIVNNQQSFQKLNQS
jgi:hypothetical protein